MIVFEVKMGDSENLYIRYLIWMMRILMQRRTERQVMTYIDDMTICKV
jgi:hypothetical protein